MQVIIKRHVRATLLLLGITGLGGVLRIWNLSGIPAGFFCDEAAVGHNAYLLLHWGMDEYQRVFPLFFESFGNWRPGLPFYTTAPFIWLFGLTEWATRIPAAIIGTATIPLLYLLTKELTDKKITAVAAALLLAVSPWHVHFSRGQHDMTYMAFGIALSVLIFLRATKTQAQRYWIAAAISFGVSFYTYYPAYLLIPCIILMLCMFSNVWSPRKRKYFLIFVLLFSLFSLPLLRGIQSKTIFNRFSQVSLSLQDKTKKEIVMGIGKTYFGHFSPDFLFLKGDIGYDHHFIKRYSVNGMGELYLYQLPLLLIGFFILWKTKRSLFFLILGFLALYPINSSFAPFADGGGPFATRSFFGVIPFTIVSAVGLSWVWGLWQRNLWQKAGAILFTVWMCVSVSSWAYEYGVRYNTYASGYWGWQYGARILMEYALSQKDSFDEIIIPDNGFNTPEIFLKFYDPEGTCADICRVGNPETLYNPERNQLFIIPNTEDLSIAMMLTFTVNKTFFYPNGSPAFFAGTFRSFLPR